MIRWIRWLLLSAVIAVGCRAPSDVKSAEREIGRVLDDFHDAAAHADRGRYFGHLADDAVFLGTDASERWSRAEFEAYAAPHFAKGKAWSFRAEKRVISLAPDANLAWFDEELATQNLGPARGSGVLARRGGRWLIVQYNLALTVPNERFALVKEAASAEVLRAPKGDPLASAAWLAGAWTITRPDGERVEEQWTSPLAGTMIGSGRTTKDSRTTFFEHIRIEARPDGVRYVAQPLGRPPTEFLRVGSEPELLVFENQAHDWPKRLTYTRVPEGVRVRVEGGAGDRVEEWTMKPAIVARAPAP